MSLDLLLSGGVWARDKIFELWIHTFVLIWQQGLEVRSGFWKVCVRGHCLGDPLPFRLNKATQLLEWQLLFSFSGFSTILVHSWNCKLLLTFDVQMLSSWLANSTLKRCDIFSNTFLYLFLTVQSQVPAHHNIVCWTTTAKTDTKHSPGDWISDCVHEEPLDRYATQEEWSAWHSYVIGYQWLCACMMLAATSLSVEPCLLPWLLCRNKPRTFCFFPSLVLRLSGTRPSVFLCRMRFGQYQPCRDGQEMGIFLHSISHLPSLRFWTMLWCGLGVGRTYLFQNVWTV